LIFDGTILSKAINALEEVKAIPIKFIPNSTKQTVGFGINGAMIAVGTKIIAPNITTGLLLGPTAIGILNDYVFGVEGVRYSMALVPFIIGVPVLLMIPFMRKRYLKELK
jgi:hypothetical protein